MPVRRDPRTGRWFFRSIVRLPSGEKVRIFGTPGCPGEFQDLPNSKVGAIEAENRAKAKALLHVSSAPPEPNKEEDAQRTVVARRPELVTVQPSKTIREHAETFLTNYKPEQKPSERRSKKQILDGHLLPHFGDMEPGQVKQTDVDTFAKAELSRPCSIKTVNNRLAVLSSLIRYVTGEKPRLRLHLDGMPADIAAVPMAEVEKLLEVCAPRERVVVLLAVEAGLRAGEIRGLQWGDIHAGVVAIRRTLDIRTNEALPPKHNKSRTVPISPRLAAALEALPRCGLWVVSRHDGKHLGYYGLVEAIAKGYAAAKVTAPEKPLHCLRHTFGTEMSKHVPLPVLQRLMGHADIKTTLRYIDVDEAQKRNAIAAVFGGRGSNMAAGGALAA